MAKRPPPSAARDEAREVTEAAREERSTEPSFGGAVFMGRARAGLVLPFPKQDPADRASGDPVIAGLAAALREHLDPDAVDREGDIPDVAMQALHEAGAFRLKIPTEYGGLGFSQMNYSRAVAAVSSWCGSTAIWMSGHQSIGVPTPLKLFGTEAQKAKFLPRMAAGEISAFALTEQEAGSDPARMQTTAVRSDDGESWILNGEKLWCTNGPKADVIVVMACTPDAVVKGRPRKQISAFIVETNSPGFEVLHRCKFMGYGGIQSGLLRLTNVRVPHENLLWKEGQGLKLALITLNTGRLTLPATNVAVAKQCLRIVRSWAKEREQWGSAIGHHEAVGTEIGWIASHTYAMQAFSDYASLLADRGNVDLRIEAAMAKLFCSETVFQVADRTMQIRGGRGYETADSLRARGDTPWPVERLFREARLNRIVEGTSEVMRLFLAREALDPHLRRAGALAEPDSSFGAKAGSFLKASAYYPFWYLARWVPPGPAPSSVPGALRGHWRAIARGSRSLARRIFHAMVRNGPSLEFRQAFLGRIVDEATDLTAMALSIARATDDGDDESIALADVFCRYARTRAKERRARPMRADRHSFQLAHDVLEGKHLGLEEGIL